MKEEICGKKRISNRIICIFAAQMGMPESYIIDLKPVQSDAIEVRYVLDDAFFAAAEGGEINSGRVDACVRVTPHSGTYTLDFRMQGVVQVSCDRCLDDLDCPVDTHDVLAVKFGPEPSDEGDDVVIVSETEGTIDVAWHLYEFVALGLPLQRVHEDGKCNEEMLRALRSHIVETAGEDDE